MTMAKQNLKSIRKKTKQQLAEKLDTATKKVLSKNIFISVKNKQGLFDIIDATNKQPVFKDVYLPETARRIVTTLVKTPKKKLQNTIKLIHSARLKYEKPVAKHYGDLIFYRHTMKTTTDTTKFYATECRAEIAIMKLKDAKEGLHSHIHTSYH